MQQGKLRLKQLTFFMILGLLLLPAQKSENIFPEVQDNNFFAVSNDELFRLIGPVSLEVVIPADILAGKLADLRPANVDVNDIQSLTDDFFYVFSTAEDSTLEEIINTYVTEQGRESMSWVLESGLSALKTVTHIRLGYLQHVVPTQYAAQVRLFGQPGDTVVQIRYKKEGGEWKIDDILGDLQQLNVPYVPRLFAPADIAAPLSGS